MAKALIVVAHPDDETIFAGNLMLAHPTWEWHWLSVTGSAERYDRMREAAREFVNRGVNIQAVSGLGLENGPLVPGDGYYERVCKGILQHGMLADIVFTHNRRGDYGHPHHCVTNYAVHWMYSNVWEFAGEFIAGMGPPWRGNERRTYIPRTGKREILDKVYFRELRAIARDRRPLFDWALWGDEVFTTRVTSIDHGDMWPE